MKIFLQDEEILKVKKLYENFQNSDNEITIDDIMNNLKDDPTNKNIKFELAEKYLSLNEIEKGFKELLQLYEEDPKWNEEAAKKEIIRTF